MLFKSKTPSPKSPAVPDLAVQPEQPAKIVAQPARPVQHSVIPAGMQIDGDLMSAGDIIVGGMIQGDITCRTLTLEGDPIIGGSVRAETIRICGSFSGDVRARKVALTKTARVVGEIHYQSLEMEAGASFEGALHRLDESDENAKNHGDTEAYERNNLRCNVGTR